MGLGNKDVWLKEVFEQYYQELVLFAIQYLRDSEMSKDFVQDLFFLLSQKELSFQSDPALKSYLYKSIRNKCLNHIKHKKVQEKYVQQVRYLSDGKESTEELEVQNRKAVLLHAAINALSPRRKEVVIKSMESNTNAEIALQLGISIQTVKNIKSEAYRSIKAFVLKQDSQEEGTSS